MAKNKPKNTNENIVNRLIVLRKMLGFSQRQLAQEFNVTPGAIANWESGRRPVPGSVIRLVEIYEENLGMLDRPRNVLNKINADWASRTLRSGITSAKLISKLAGSNLKQIVAGNERATQIKEATDQLLAQELTASLGELKGLMMKIGQMMVYMNFALPKNVRTLLESLQDSTTPMSQDAVSQVFINSFGKRPQQIFKTWEPYPFAAASIGQVHRATLDDGTAVAVKVQYPGIVKALKSDLKNAHIIEKMLTTLFRNQEKGDAVEELKERILEECDYRIEAKNTQHFGKLYNSHPHIFIPKVYPELSCEHILVSEYCKGQRFREFLATASQEEKNLAGKTIFEFTFTSIFRHGIFNCDPNGGNFLFTGKKVVFLDFGCVKTFDDEFIENWKQMAAAMLDRDKEATIAFEEKFGFFPRVDQIDVDYQFEAAMSLAEPYLDDCEYTFTNRYVENTWRKFISDNPDKYRTGMPKDWVFNNRLQWGVCALLGELNATANWHRMWIEYVDYKKYGNAKHAL